MNIYNDHQLYSIIGPNSYYSHTTETIHELVTADKYNILQFLERDLPKIQMATRKYTHNTEIECTLPL